MCLELSPKLTGRAISLKQLARRCCSVSEERKRWGWEKRERALKSSLEWRYYENGWSARKPLWKKEERIRSICVLSLDHSIKLTAVFGICISIWTYAKKGRFPLAHWIWIIRGGEGNVNWRNGLALAARTNFWPPFSPILQRERIEK